MKVSLTLPTFLLALGALGVPLRSEPLLEPVPSEQPSPAQLAQIGRKYGMFCHFGINTYMDQEWTDGTVPPEKYAPPADLEAGIDDWIRTARDAGMRYFLCIAKHHDGFCLWDSKLTDYDVGNPKVKNRLDVVGAVSKACQKYGIAFAVYYSLWDRHDKSYADPAKYRDYMIGQLRELMSGYGPVSELWLDGGWLRPAKDWYMPEVYDAVKKLQPDCQISVNWTIGAPGKADTHMMTPDKQKNGYPIRYFPSDFRLGDPFLPATPDPKLFTHAGKTYYLPYESTVTVSGQNHWFYNTHDNTAKSVDALEDVFNVATAQDNCLVLNVPPDRSGRLVDVQKQAILDLAKRLNLGPGKPFPKPVANLAISAKATADSVWSEESGFEPGKAIDGNRGTRWASKTDDATFTLAWDSPVAVSGLRIAEYSPDNAHYRATTHAVEVDDGSGWREVASGGALGAGAKITFKPVRARALRIRVHGDRPVSLWEVSVLGE